MQLMEIAGWQVARLVDGLLDGAREKRVTIVAGAGNNGGDALVAARFLHQRGAIVQASILRARDPNSLAARHALTLERMGIPIMEAPNGIDASADVLVDGLFGTGIRLPLRDPAPAIIEAMNASRVRIVAVDVPSGLDADSGAGGATPVRATATLTLVAPKPGLHRSLNAGRVFVADIGMPTALFSTESDTLSRLYAIGELVELADPEMNSSTDRPH